MGRHPVRVLWAVPRTVSTAFERMVIERGDHTVVDEPFSRHYYFGPARRSRRFSEVDAGATPERIRADLAAAARDRPVFVKDMAYHVTGLVTPEWMAGFESAFLVRDPARAIPSLAARWPDFTDEEAGYGALADALTAARAAGQRPLVLDADELCADPERAVGAWCDAMGLDHRPAALTWEPGMRPEWVLWRDWYGSAASSTGFAPPPTGPPPVPATPRIAAAIAAARPVYERVRGA